MAQPTPPTISPEDLAFANDASSSTQIAQPDEAHRLGQGWLASEYPRMIWFNYLMKGYYLFIKYFNDCVEDIYTTIGIFSNNFVNINEILELDGEYTGIVTYADKAISINGFSTPLSTTLRYKKTAPYTGVSTKTVVKLYIDGVENNSDNNASSMSCAAGTLPAEIRPASGSRYIPISVIDNSYAGVDGMIKLDSDGTITFMIGIVNGTRIVNSGSGFSANGTKGIPDICVEYFM